MELLASKNVGNAFCSSVDDLPRLARLHGVLSRDPTIKLGSFVSPSGKRTRSEGETFELLLLHIFPILGLHGS